MGKQLKLKFARPIKIERINKKEIYFNGSREWSWWVLFGVMVMMGIMFILKVR